MKKEFITGSRVFMAVAALLPLLVIRQFPQTAQAAADYRTSEKNIREIVLLPEKRLMKTIPLDADTVTQIPRYIVEEDTAYVLDEDSVVVEETGQSSAEGADVVTTVRKVEKLPDNDLERIERSIVREGLSYDLLYVVYEVTKEDEDGIPILYSADCIYGGLEKYSRSYPSSWQAVIWYDAYEITEDPEIAEEYETYEYAEGKTVGTIRRVRGKNRAKSEERPVPEPEVKKYILKKIRPGEKEEEKKNIEFPLPLAAGVLGAGLLIPFMIWISLLTVPLYALKKEEKYRYIGQIRLKKENEIYTAYLTKRLIAKADIPVFKIKVPERIRKKAKEGILQVHCPDGKKITLICGKEVGFTLERE